MFLLQTTRRRFLKSYAALVLLVTASAASALTQNSPRTAATRPATASQRARTVAQDLGFGPAERLLIIHGDDAGMCHSANLGTIDAMTRGIVNSASIMVPCPWLLEIAAHCREHPDLDFGLHLTLTSEWNHYRWGPAASRDQVSSLLDPEGHLWRGVQDVALHGKGDEVERELRAQVKRALALGIRPTHLDTHMGTVFARPDFFHAYYRVANEFKLPCLLPRFSEERLATLNAWTRMQAAALKTQVPDSRAFTLDDLVSIEGNVPLEKQEQFYVDTIRKLKPGITQIIIHCGVEGEELKAITGTHARRDMDRQVFCDPEIRAVIKSEGIHLITWREIGERQREHLNLHGSPAMEGNR